MWLFGKRRMATFGAITAITLAATAGPVAGSSAERADASQAASRYIVTLTTDVNRVATAADAQLSRVADVQAERVFREVGAYTARLTPAQARAMVGQPGVLSVEKDAKVQAFVTQQNAPWGLDRIDQRALPLSTTYTYTRTGLGVTAYIIDTGIRTSHTDFGGRARVGFDSFGGSGQDCNGHGTHVASTVGGNTYGVAKRTTLVAVRVLNCSGSGSLSSVIAGLDYVTGNHQAGRPAVANMSLGGGASTSIDAAVNRAINDGVTVAVAAGNSSANACNASPARVPNAFTVAASTRTDGFASFSNRGSCVDIIAPGVGITAAWSTSNTATRTISGTSMATPHTAGAAAKFLEGSPSASPSTVMSNLRNTATTGAITGVPSGTANRLLFTNL